MCLCYIFIGNDCFKNGDSCTSAELWCPQFITEHVHSMTICGVASMKSMYPVAWKPKYFLFSAVLYVCSLDLVLGKCNLVIFYIKFVVVRLHLGFLWWRKLQQRRLLTMIDVWKIAIIVHNMTIIIIFLTVIVIIFIANL